MTNDATPANVRLTDELGADENMLAHDPYNLDFVLMPLVRMLAEMQLSWSDRKQIAHAIIATTAHYKSMMDEHKLTPNQSPCDVPGMCAKMNRTCDVCDPLPADDAPERACTCHPDDEPPQPCAKQYALAECRAMSYATTLATAIHAKHYPEVTQWEPLPDLLGVLTQIDNMTAGLVRPNAELSGAPLAERPARTTG